MEDMPTYCPACLNTDCIVHNDLGDEIDSDGEFGSHNIECTICGRRTCDMDTLDDAIEAWEERGDVVHYDGADTVLMRITDIQELIEKGVVISRSDLRDKDLRNRLNTGY